MRTPVRPAALALCLAALLSGCAAGTDSGDDPTIAVPTAAPSAPTTSPATAAASPTPAVRTIAVAYAGGKVTGTSGREPVRLGERVVLRVTSDVAEEVHVHGYDLQVPVAAGSTVDIPVTASIPGGFEVELHESGRVLFQLRVA